MQREYIKKEAWVKILEFLEKENRIYIKNKTQTKKFIKAVYWIIRTGAQWRELPLIYGCWNSVFKRFNSWSKKGIWKDLFDYCIQDPDLEYVMIDATVVRAHACAAGFGNHKKEGFGRSHGGFTTKIHAKVDALGNPLKFIITPGQCSDFTQAEELLKTTTSSYVLGDKGYDSDNIRTTLKKQKCIPVIPGKNNRKVHIDYDKHIYKERYLIECFFSKIKYFRRVFSRFDKSICNYMAMLCFVGAIIWLR
jgi:transposase